MGFIGDELVAPCFLCLRDLGLISLFVFLSQLVLLHVFSYIILFRLVIFLFLLS